ncbi:hypothetical protein LOAG_00092 [Loa loa]|uniref:Uncharacterized protein n=1 Tax=Loa loa TaxID=7209 RepID=A0A1S0UBY5_LOALO|nr:hypothetical protein LOAG_00092 [Loa loa]EFO28403.1 hypothetical protein LOAG_00092 [Loa loa]
MFSSPIRSRLGSQLILITGREVCYQFAIPGIREVCYQFAIPGIREVCYQFAIPAIPGIREVCYQFAIPGEVSSVTAIDLPSSGKGRERGVGLEVTEEGSYGRSMCRYNKELARRKFSHVVGRKDCLDDGDS